MGVGGVGSLPKPLQKETTNWGLSRSLLPGSVMQSQSGCYVAIKTQHAKVQCPSCQIPLPRLMTLFQETLCCCPYSNQLLQIAGDWWSPTPGSLQPPNSYILKLFSRHTTTEHTRSALELSLSCLFWTHWLVIYLSNCFTYPKHFSRFSTDNVPWNA